MVSSLLRGQRVCLQDSEVSYVVLIQQVYLYLLVPTGMYVVPTGRYVVPTGRVIATVSIKVPAGRYIVPAGYIVPTGRTT
ncbi:hypothetical protein Tco_0485033 [Tanacetum coccineum]